VLRSVQVGSIFNDGSQGGFHKVAFEQRLEARELSEWIRGSPLPASRKNQCQNSKAELCLAGLRNIKDATMVEQVRKSKGQQEDLRSEI